MFKLAKVNTVEWPVTVNIPQDGGRTVKSTFMGIFEVLESDTIDEVNGAAGDVLARSFKGWKSGVADDGGADLEPSAENVARLIKIPYVRAGLWVAFGELQNGRAAATKP